MTTGRRTPFRSSIAGDNPRATAIAFAEIRSSARAARVQRAPASPTGASPAALLQRLLADLRQRGGWRDHFLGEAQLEQRRAARGARAVERRGTLLGGLD